MTSRRITPPVLIAAPSTVAFRRTVSAHLLPASGRPIRFALTGGTAGFLQLTLLYVLTRHGWAPDLANGLAFLVAAQANFLLSSTFTWPDRRDDGMLGRRWLTFHGAIAGMAVLNLLVSSAARHVMTVLPSAGLGILIAAAGNFLLGDRLVFRKRDRAATIAGPFATRTPKEKATA